MKKRIIAAMLALALISALFTGCDSETAPASTAPAEALSGTLAEAQAPADATPPKAFVAGDPAAILPQLEEGFNNRDITALIACFEPAAAFDLWGDVAIPELTVQQTEEFLTFASQVFSTSELIGYYDWWYDTQWSNAAPTAQLTEVDLQIYDDFADLTFTTVLSHANGFEYSRHDSTLQMICIQGAWYLSAVQTSWAMDSTSMYYQFFPPIYEGELFVAYRDGKYGFVDENDEAIFPFVYDEVGEFADGLCPVFSKAENRWGYLDKRGRVITGYQYLDARNFVDGYACVKAAHNSNWGVINTNTITCISFEYEAIGKYAEGLFPAQMNSYWGFVRPDPENSESITVIDFTYSEIMPNGFEYGRIGVSINGAWGVIDPSGNEIVPLNRDNGSMRYNSTNFFQLGADLYNSEGSLLRSDTEIHYAGINSDKCIIKEGDSDRQQWIINASGDMTDLTLLALDAVSNMPWNKGRVYLGNPYRGDGAGEWTMINVLADGPTNIGSILYNFVNVEGEFLFDEWVTGRYSNVKNSNPVRIFVEDESIIVNQKDDGRIVIWNQETGSHIVYDYASSDFSYFVDEVWNGFAITVAGGHALYDTRGNSIISEFFITQQVGSHHAIVQDENRIFYGYVDLRDGNVVLEFPIEYTKIEYINYGQSNGYVTFVKGAQQTRYWLGPNGNLIEVS